MAPSCHGLQPMWNSSSSECRSRSPMLLMWLFVCPAAVTFDCERLGQLPFWSCSTCCTSAFLAPDRQGISLLARVPPHVTRAHIVFSGLLKAARARIRF